MSATSTERTVGSLVAEYPGSFRVFERYGIDYCCGGKRRVADVCREKGISEPQLLAELQTASQQAMQSGTRDWTKANLKELCENIVATHHEFMKRELPRLEQLAHKVANVHGDRHPELRRVAEIYDNLKAELDAHLMKEENILFPLCQQLESSNELPYSHCGSVGNPIRVMEFEHDSAGEALAELHQITNNFALPADACGSYRALFEGLQDMERDLHEHIHKENNILFPRAVAREQELHG